MGTKANIRVYQTVEQLEFLKIGAVLLLLASVLITASSEALPASISTTTGRPWAMSPGRA